MSYAKKTPCDKCPFRKDVAPYLTGPRVHDIAMSLERSEFPCHETVKYDQDGEPSPYSKTVHCAGALILLEKLEQPSQMMRIAERLGIYDRTKLNMDAPIFDTFRQMQKHHAKGRRDRS